jgi:AcrR family transcriptional regulator
VTSTAVTTRERILAAAMTLFGRYGYRRTSMEDIASEAGLSRAALYLRFRNKEDIFRELARGLHDAGLADAERSLLGSEPLTDRLCAAVEAKTLRMIELAYESPHGSELLDENNRLCGDLATDSERRFHGLLAGGFRDADGAGTIDLAAAGLTPVEAADLFGRAVHGLKGPGNATDEYRTRLRRLVNVFVAGLGGERD